MINHNGPPTTSPNAEIDTAALPIRFKIGLSFLIPTKKQIAANTNAMTAMTLKIVIKILSILVPPVSMKLYYIL